MGNPENTLTPEYNQVLEKTIDPPFTEISVSDQNVDIKKLLVFIGITVVIMCYRYQCQCRHQLMASHDID